MITLQEAVTKTKQLQDSTPTRSKVVSLINELAASKLLPEAEANRIANLLADMLWSSGTVLTNIACLLSVQAAAATVTVIEPGAEPIFTLAAGLDVQRRQLDELKLKLKSVVFNDLVAECHKQNYSLSAGADGYRVWRGTCMDTFVANWHRTQDSLQLRVWHAEYKRYRGMGSVAEKPLVVVADTLSAATAAVLAEFSFTSGQDWVLKEISLDKPAVIHISNHAD